MIGGVICHCMFGFTHLSASEAIQKVTEFLSETARFQSFTVDIDARSWGSITFKEREMTQMRMRVVCSTQSLYTCSRYRKMAN